jgi:hypothetical protein
MNWKERYGLAYVRYQTRKHPVAMATGYFKARFPQVTKANGLTNMIINLLTWEGHRATRISTTGRVVNGRYIPGTTRKGTADISATIKGRSVMIEVKVGKDRPSEWQLAEQERERAAGGIYEFVRTPEEFFELYDRLVK